MPIYRFPIKGIGYHDFAGHLDELYELAPGNRMSISIEHNNEKEPDAVIVYWGKKLVGYVRSGEPRTRALSLLESSGRGSILGKIVDVERENRVLWLEINTDVQITVAHDDGPNLLTNWTFDGETLPIDEEEHRLHTMLCNLEMTTAAREPWDSDMEEWLEYVEENLWRDISRETSNQVTGILAILTAGGATIQEYAQAASRLQLALDAMGRTQARRLQAQQIIDKAHSNAMTLLLLGYADSAKEAIRQLPDALVTLFLKDGEAFMGRLWYLHPLTKQVHAIKTLLAMMVRLKDNSGEAASTSIPREWLLQWAEVEQDKQIANFVQKALCRFELERTNPALARDIAAMMNSCNAQKMSNENASRIAAAIEKQKPSMNDNNGIVAGGNFEARIGLTDDQVKLLADRVAANGNKGLLD